MPGRSIQCATYLECCCAADELVAELGPVLLRSVVGLDIIQRSAMSLALLGFGRVKG